VPWNSFITVTFREPRESYQAESSLRQVLKVLDKPQRAFLGVELHESKAIHIHGLLHHGRLDDELVEDARRTRRLLWWKLYTTFGRSQVLPPAKMGGVIAYCTKYCIKGLADFLVV